VGRYDSHTPTWFLVLIDCYKIPEPVFENVYEAQKSIPENQYRLAGNRFLGSLKVPKREIFVTELFTLSDPICIADLRIEPKNAFV
jgi:hypothetical protein